MQKKKKTIKDPEIYLQTRHMDQEYKRVVLLLLTLPADEQVRVLKNFTADEAKAFLMEIKETGALSERDVKKIREEFGCHSFEINPNPCGGPDLARRLQNLL